MCIRPEPTPPRRNAHAGQPPTCLGRRYTRCGGEGKRQPRKAAHRQKAKTFSFQCISVPAKLFCRVQGAGQGLGQCRHKGGVVPASPADKPFLWLFWQQGAGNALCSKGGKRCCPIRRTQCPDLRQSGMEAHTVERFGGRFMEKGMREEAVHQGKVGGTLERQLAIGVARYAGVLVGPVIQQGVPRSGITRKNVPSWVTRVRLATPPILSAATG